MQQIMVVQLLTAHGGGTGGGQFEQDVITYASIVKNSLVVCAAGNDNSPGKFFPAILYLCAISCIY